jgi:hypothetical protein
MRSSMKRILALSALASLALSVAASSARLSLVTILPGKALYSSFGHSAIRVVDAGKGSDELFNFGLSAKPFDANFALNMLAGRMEFMVGALDTGDALRYYREVENRGIVEQALDLDDGRKAELIAMLKKAARPESSVYNYRYFTDNCATRPAAMLRAVVGDDAPPFAGESSRTLRSSVAEVLKPRPWLGLAVGFLLGPLADRPIPEGPIFLPEDLMSWAARASYDGPEGRKALVGGTQTLYVPKSSALSRPGASPLLASILVLAFALFASTLSARFAPLRRVFDGALFAVAFVLALAILLFWLGAGYREVGMNLNLLWAGPLPLLALVLGRRDSLGALSTWVFRVAALAALIAAVGGGWGLQSMPVEARLLAAALCLRCALNRDQARVIEARSSKKAGQDLATHSAPSISTGASE